MYSLYLSQNEEPNVVGSRESDHSETRVSIVALETGNNVGEVAQEGKPCEKPKNNTLEASTGTQPPEVAPAGKKNLDITARTPLKELDPNRELARTSPSLKKTMPFSVTADSQGPITGKEEATTAEAKTSPPISIQTPELQEDTRPAGDPSTQDDQSSPGCNENVRQVLDLSPPKPKNNKPRPTWKSPNAKPLAAAHFAGRRREINKHYSEYNRRPTNNTKPRKVFAGPKPEWNSPNALTPAPAVSPEKRKEINKHYSGYNPRPANIKPKAPVATRPRWNSPSALTRASAAVSPEKRKEINKYYNQISRTNCNQGQTSPFFLIDMFWTFHYLYPIPE